MRRSEPPLAPPGYFDSVVKEPTSSLIPHIPRGIPRRSRPFFRLSRRIPHPGDLLSSRERDASSSLGLIHRPASPLMGEKRIIPRPSRFMMAANESFPGLHVVRERGNGTRKIVHAMHIIGNTS